MTSTFHKTDRAQAPKSFIVSGYNGARKQATFTFTPFPGIQDMTMVEHDFYKVEELPFFECIEHHKNIWDAVGLKYEKA